MYKVSVVGIDNSGKTTLVRSLSTKDRVQAIHYSSYRDASSRFARVSGKFCNMLTDFSERHGLRTLAGVTYSLHLIPYFAEENRKKQCALLVSDRDPILDVMCYSGFYLGSPLCSVVKEPLRHFLKNVFPYPEMYIHLEVSPEISLARAHDANKVQLHDTRDTLAQIRNLLDYELFEMERQGIEVLRLDAGSKPPESIEEEVRYVLRGKLCSLYPAPARVAVGMG